MLTIMRSILVTFRLVHYVMIVSRRFPIILRPLSMLGTEGTILTRALLQLATATQAAQQRAEIWSTPIEKFGTVNEMAAVQGKSKLIAHGLG